MRLLSLVLLVLVCLIQYPLWFGKGGWFKVWDLQKQVATQRGVNEGMRARNAALDAEVRDLQVGTGALEERARSELGMMKDGEVFVQIVPSGAPTQNSPPVPPAAPAPASNGGSPRR
jgi:cell division protein FtsB